MSANLADVIDEPVAQFRKRNIKEIKIGDAVLDLTAPDRPQKDRFGEVVDIKDQVVELLFEGARDPVVFSDVRFYGCSWILKKDIRSHKEWQEHKKKNEKPWYDAMQHKQTRRGRPKKS